MFSCCYIKYLLLSANFFGLTFGVIDDSEKNDLHPRHIVLNDRILNTRTALQFHEEQHPSRHFRGLSIDERLAHPDPGLFLVHIDDKRHSRHELSEHIGRSSFDSLQYLPHNTFVMHANHSIMQQIQQAPVVLWIGNFDPNSKMSPTVGEQDVLAETTITNGTLMRRYGYHGGHILAVSLLASTTMNDAKLITERIRLSIERMDKLNEPIRVSVVRANRIRVEAQNFADLQAVAEECSHDPSVLFVERRLVPRKYNRWTRGILQNGLQSTADYTNSMGILAFDHGLRGQGQVLGIADSGIDTRHCFFSDVNGIPFKEHQDTPTESDFLASDAAGRKIVQVR